MPQRMLAQRAPTWQGEIVSTAEAPNERNPLPRDWRGSGAQSLAASRRKLATSKHMSCKRKRFWFGAALGAPTYGEPRDMVTLFDIRLGRDAGAGEAGLEETRKTRGEA